MSASYDLVIAGAGCAGLSLAWHLIEAGVQDRRIALVDRSFAPTADRLWCFWGADDLPFTEMATHSWTRAQVAFEASVIDERLEGQRYHCVRSEDFKAAVIARLEASPIFDLITADICDLGEDAEGAYVTTSEGTIRATWLAQSVRYGKDDQANAPRYPVRQHFGGIEIVTPEPIFDPERFTMMDFRVPQRDGVAFVYVLPFAPNKALIEHTMFSSNPLTNAAHREAAQEYVESALATPYTVEREEFGSLPMDDRYPAQQSSPHVYNIGIVGGQMKPSTGYAFQRIQAHTRALAQRFARDGRLEAVEESPNRFRFYDILLLRILHEQAALGRDVFKRLFQAKGIAPVLAFLSERTRLRDELALVWRLPWLPFLRGIPSALGRLRRPEVPRAPRRNAPGLIVALSIITLWALAMVLGLSYQHPGAGHVTGDLLWVALTTFLSTGVFITAHDAMHGLIAPGNARLNRALGWFATWSYAGLDYDTLERAHHAHHAQPASDADPDFHRGNAGFIAWYVSFMRQYLSWRQFGWLCVLLATMLLYVDLPVWRVAAFWAAPLILSTFQLFIVGTWLPHRPGDYLGDGALRARSLDLPPLLSFFACYHFGYHFEHHARPDLPWWRLWRIRGFRASKV